MAILDRQHSALNSASPSSLISDWLNQQLAEFTYCIRMLPWPLSLGAVLILISLVIALAMLIPQISARNQLQQRASELRQHAPSIEPTQMQRTPEALLKNFHKTLPPESAAPSLVGLVLEAASDHGITPDKVEYQLSSNNKSPYRLYQLTLPVHAEYVAVRKFANQILNSLPNAAISEMSFRRDESGDGLVEARLRITLYMSAPQP